MHLVQDFKFSFEILSPSLSGWLLPPCRLPPGKLTCLNYRHHGEFCSCPLYLSFLPGLSKTLAKERDLPCEPCLCRKADFFQLRDCRRRDSYDKAVQKITLISHIKWFFITANAWLLGRRPKLIDIIYLKLWQPVALLVSSSNTSSNVKHSLKIQSGLMYNYFGCCTAFSCVLFNCLVIYRI